MDDHNIRYNLAIADEEYLLSHDVFLRLETKKMFGERDSIQQKIRANMLELERQQKMLELQFNERLKEYKRVICEDYKRWKTQTGKSSPG